MNSKKNSKQGAGRREQDIMRKSYNKKLKKPCPRVLFRLPHPVCRSPLFLWKVRENEAAYSAAFGADSALGFHELTENHWPWSIDLRTNRKLIADYERDLSLNLAKFNWKQRREDRLL